MTFLPKSEIGRAIDQRRSAANTPTYSINLQVSDERGRVHHQAASKIRPSSSVPYAAPTDWCTILWGIARKVNHLETTVSAGAILNIRSVYIRLEHTEFERYAKYAVTCFQKHKIQIDPQRWERNTYLKTVTRRNCVYLNMVPYENTRACLEIPIQNLKLNYWPNSVLLLNQHGSFNCGPKYSRQSELLDKIYFYQQKKLTLNCFASPCSRGARHSGRKRSQHRPGQRTNKSHSWRINTPIASLATAP